MTIRLMWGYMPHNILFYLHFIYATSYSTTKIPIISYLHIYIINMNKKKDNTSLHIIFRIIQNINYPAPRVKGRKIKL